MGTMDLTAGKRWWPERGVCCVCGKALDSYDSKYLSQVDDRMYCCEHGNDHDRPAVPDLDNFRYYTDG